MEKLKEAKRKLYLLLLIKDGGKSESKLTDNEIEIMFYLSKDEQIQEILQNK